MLIFRTQKELQNHLNSNPKKNSLGLVPTMGALHNGHLELVRTAVLQNKTVVVSIFVNPTQFDKKEDLEKYPKTFEADKRLLETVSNDLIIFAPSETEIYGNAIESKTYDFDGLDKVMEGAFRDDHFNGVGTIVETLLKLVQPTRAYFGEKDYQQLQIIKKLVSSQQIPVEIVPCPIVREQHGLAMSSRNERLSKETRLKAGYIYQILQAAKIKFGTKSASYVKDWVAKEFENYRELELEYFEMTEAENLLPVIEKSIDKKYRAFIAVYADGVRLIDNIALN
ncbi:pantoate--beta-alanine ligase [Cytophaga sp. FL35]|uniref:pantoate--beta-alanine ligase n=1 Tax=Cytophaga sp. FL35 TaxID=1904456 RepID=UPI001653BD37|nr:pantoate--beta-alanine ligase [Cytophaga sp. FL35]MBC6997714.1 pantoate--beta-alanine ligase [Cytophaga sp. FL35]